MHANREGSADSRELVGRSISPAPDLRYRPSVPRCPTLLAMCLLACGGGDDASAPAGPPIRFLHTFGAEETELFNAIVVERRLTVESSLVPFARGQQVISAILAGGTDCPDLMRIDATWLPGLRTAGYLAPVPADLAARDWTPEAKGLVASAWRSNDQLFAVPQTVDGLVVVRDSSRPAPASPAITDVVAAARATKTPSSPYPLGVRVDGYWFVPWLRAEGGELRPTGIGDVGAVVALEKFAALYGDVASPPPPSGTEAPDELRRWNAHELAYWITGPWQLGALRDRDRLAITPLAHAPRGGQVLVVPTCARAPAEGWRLAAELTDTPALARFAAAFATVPTRESALASSPPLVRALYEALKSAEPLPRAVNTPLLFDDLNPALAAAVARDATPTEAIDGVRHGWHRLTRGEGHP